MPHEDRCRLTRPPKKSNSLGGERAEAEGITALALSSSPRRKKRLLRAVLCFAFMSDLAERVASLVLGNGSLGGKLCVD